MKKYELTKKDIENLELELVVKQDSVEEIREMKENDQAVTKIFDTNIEKVEGFNHAWIIKLADKTIGYTDLIVEQKTFKYYINLGLKAGYRTKSIITKVLNKIKEQALSETTYLESRIDRYVVETTMQELNINNYNQNKTRVYSLKNR